MTDVRAALTEHLRHRSSPVLFIGSGLTRRYTGAENWEGLLRHFAEITARPYDYYRTQADGYLPAVATAITGAFHNIWWDNEKFKASQEKYAAGLAGRESPLKVEVALYLTGLADKLPTTGTLAAELDLLRKAVVDAVITTNHDDVLPTLFPDFRPFVFGVGIQAKFGDEGYVGLTREQLIDDILGDRASFDPHQIVYRSLPHILSTPGNVPVFKYLRGVGALDGTGEIKESADVSPKIKKMASKIRAGLPASAVHARKAPTILTDIASIADLEAKLGRDDVINYGTCMPEDKVDPTELRKFLNDNRDLRDTSWAETQYIKLVCFLDWLENGRARPSAATSKMPGGSPSLHTTEATAHP